MGVDVVLRRAHSGSSCARHPHRSGELRLPTGSMQEHHHPASDRLGDVGAVVGLDHRRARDRCLRSRRPTSTPCRHGCRSGRDSTVRRGYSSASCLCPGPVSRHGATVEQPGFRSDERAAAHRRDAVDCSCAAPPNPADERLVVSRRLATPSPPGISSVSIFMPTRRQWERHDLQPALGRDRCAARRNDGQVVTGGGPLLRRRAPRSRRRTPRAARRRRAAACRRRRR